MWNDNKFYIQRMSESSPLEYIGIKNNNTIVVQSNKYIYNILLRWKNHKGIQNPAWQIKLLNRPT